MARLVPTQNKPTLTLGELNEFFENGPHLDKDDIEGFEEDINVIKSLKLTDWGNKWD